MTRIALVTAEAARHLDQDLPPLEEALRARGVEVTLAVWDDPAVDWSDVDLAVVRSAWDYAARRDEFVAWANRVATRTALANPAPVLRWTTDKRYLVELEAAGVPITPTVVVEPGDGIDLRDLAAGELVVKPAIGAGSLDAQRFPADARPAAARHLGRLLAEERAALVQPYLTGVDDEGETALVFLAGRFSHAVRKGPILRTDGTVFVEGLYAEEELDARDATADQLAVALAALAAVPNLEGEALLYARVDVVPGPDGAPVVLEVELAEPSLFLGLAPGAADRFAAAIVALAGHR